jgi:hypothetical protein
MGFHIVQPHIMLDATNAKIVIKRSEMIFNARRITAIASMIDPCKS